MVKAWYSLFSHTGKETEAIMRALHLEPAAVLTTNLDYNGPLLVKKFATGKQVNEWLMSSNSVQPDSIITLNGYMRILPANVIKYLEGKGCKIFNIHPAPIGLYPELKGKDPQERLFEGLRSGKYAYLGEVIHRVDAGLDTGKIVYQVTRTPPACFTKEDIYSILHKDATDMWIKFFQEEMYNE